MLKLVSTQNQPTMPNSATSATDDHTLLERIVQGDNAAFEIFYKTYYPRLFRFILRITQRADSVEELIQETLLVVWEKPDTFNHQSKISTWVLGIAYNKALKSLSRSARESQDTDIEDWIELIGDPKTNPELVNENQDWLSQALLTLPPEQRAVIELTFYHDLPYQEIAKVLNCPENTVKTRMFHARKKLKSFAASQMS